MRASTVARAAALLCFGGCLLLFATTDPAHPPLVVGPAVPRASWLAAALAFAGCVAATAGFALATPPTPRPVARRVLAFLASLGRVVAGLVGLASALGVGLLDAGDEYRLVSPTGPGGCRVLLDVEDYRTEVLVVPRHAVVAHRTGVEVGTTVVPGPTHVAWDGGTATVTLVPRSPDAVPEVRRVTCG